MTIYSHPQFYHLILKFSLLYNFFRAYDSYCSWIVDASVLAHDSLYNLISRFVKNNMFVVFKSIFKSKKIFFFNIPLTHAKHIKNHLHVNQLPWWISHVERKWKDTNNTNNTMTYDWWNVLFVWLLSYYLLLLFFTFFLFIFIFDLFSSNRVNF